VLPGVFEEPLHLLELRLVWLQPAAAPTSFPHS
jgi:hypothetical protein